MGRQATPCFLRDDSERILKICPKCGAEKSLEEFFKCKKNRSGLSSFCKDCGKKRARLWRESNPEREKEKKRLWVSNNEKRYKEKQKQWKKKNPDFYKPWRLKNKKRFLSNAALWKKNNPDKVRKYKKKGYLKKRLTPKGLLDCRMNSALSYALRGKKNGRRWQTLVGYSAEELKNHLESRFDNGMSWDNIGEWHIDHIVPKSRFNYDKPDHPEFRVCWGLSNLQPLWKKDNLSKGDMTMEEWKAAK